MSRELFQTALEFCHDLLAEWEWKKGERAGLGEEYDELLEFISTLKHEIVKPLPKPVAVIGETYYLLWTGKGHLTHGVKVGDKLYAEPPARKGLTDDEIAKYYHGPIPNLGTAIAFARSIEAAHSITDPEQSKPQSNAI
jgi:hypothetical protein